MAYQAILNGTQQLTISNQGMQTQITLTSSSPGQQQSQSSSFTTGSWVRFPQLFHTEQGFILQIEGSHGQYFIQIQSNGISTINGIPPLSNSTPVDLETVADPPEQKVNFEPMQPLGRSKMSMNINSMSMQMGNMSLNLGKKFRKTATKRFCSQCGVKAKPSDRFCSSCGHPLNN
jgi:ribosomal protein L37E